MTFGSKALKARKRIDSRSLKLLQRDLLILIFIHNIKNNIDNMIRLLLVCLLVCRLLLRVRVVNTVHSFNLLLI